jgi:hypothetical protein
VLDNKGRKEGREGDRKEKRGKKCWCRTVCMIIHKRKLNAFESITKI